MHVHNARPLAHTSGDPALGHTAAGAGLAAGSLIALCGNWAMAAGKYVGASAQSRVEERFALRSKLWMPNRKVLEHGLTDNSIWTGPSEVCHPNTDGTGNLAVGGAVAHPPQPPAPNRSCRHLGDHGRAPRGPVPGQCPSPPPHLAWNRRELFKCPRPWQPKVGEVPAAAVHAPSP